MHRPSLRLALAAALAATLSTAGCRDPEPPPAPPPPLTDTLATAPDTLRADTTTGGSGAVKTGTMRVEGQDEAVRLVAFDAPALPFTTYLPEGEFDARVAATADGTEATFGWTRARGPSGEPRASVVVAAPGVSPDSLLAAFLAAGAAQGRTVNADAGASPCLWAVAGHAFTDEVSGATGIVCVGVHGGRAFRVATEADPERAEGFAARFDVLLREWRWRDTGLGLDDAVL